MSQTIFKFAVDLIGLNMKPSYETTVDKKKVTFRLVEGDSELNIKNQSESATPIYYKVNTQTQVETDETVIEWLENHPRFGKLITVFDPVKATEAKLLVIETELDIIDEVRGLSENDSLSLGYVLFGKDVLSTNPRVLKHDLIKAAMTDTAMVKDKMDKKQNSEELFVGLALATEVIKEADAGTVIKWSHNDARITSVTKGITPVQELVNYFKTTEGRIVQSEINTRVKEKFAELVVSETNESEATDAAADGVKDDSETPLTPAQKAAATRAANAAKK